MRWIVLAMLIAAGMLNYVDRQVIAVLKPIIAQDLHWSDADYGHLASLFQLSAALAYLCTGWITDRLGVRWANPVGVAAWSLAAMAHGWARTVVQFSLARVALGATESMGTPTGIKTIAGLFDADRRSTAFGISNGAANLGAIVTPLVIPFVGVAVGWRETFLLVGAAGLIWVAIWLSVIKRSTFAASAPASPASPPALAGYGGMLRDRRTWAIAGAKALSDQVWWLLLFWTPDFFHRVFHLTITEAGVALAVVYSCAAVGSLTAGVVSTRLVRRGLSINTVRKVGMLACALLVTPLPLAVHVQNYWLAVALLGLALAAHQGFSVSLFSTITDIIPRARVGSVTSFGALCGNLAGMALLYLAGESLSAGFGYTPLLLLAAVSYLLALGWLQLLVPRLQLAEPAVWTSAPSLLSPGRPA